MLLPPWIQADGICHFLTQSPSRSLPARTHNTNEANTNKIHNFYYKVYNIVSLKEIYIYISRVSAKDMGGQQHLVGLMKNVNLGLRSVAG